MRRPRSWALLPPAAVCALLTVWIVLWAANVQAATVSLLIYGLANLIVYTDALDSSCACTCAGAIPPRRPPPRTAATCR